MSAARRGLGRSRPQDSGASLVLVLILAALQATPAAAIAPAEGGGGLEIEVSGPLFVGSELVVDVRQSGALAGKRLALQLAVDGASVGRFEASGDRTTLRASTPSLTAGRHEILVKSGSVRATATIRVWPRWIPLAAGAAAVGAVAFLLFLRSRRGA